MKKRFFKVFLMLISMIFSVMFVHDMNEVHASSSYYEKVTSSLSDWSGDYLIVYQDGNKAYVFNGTDSTNNYVSATISNNTIESTTALDGVKVTIGADGSIKTKNGYIYGTSGSNKLNFSSNANKNTFAVESSGIKITSNTSVLRFNAVADQMRFRYFKSSSYSNQKPIQLYKYVEGSSEGGNEDPTPEPEVNYEDDVKALFSKYYNNGVYKKNTVLEVNDDVMNEVNVYFHASQTTKERTTWYYDGGLRMQVAGIEDSIYEDKDGKVYHTGYNGDWYVEDQTSVENWFTTLYDFKAISNTKWSLENGFYTTSLVATTASSEHILTKYAREFVAPMWLAPNADNWNYVTFTKLTVKEYNNSLIMTLYASGEDIEGKLTNTKGIFSIATITKEEYVEDPNEDPNDPEDTPTTPVDVNISFASLAQRTSFSTTKQVWENNGVVLTNNKAASSSDVADYSNPARFYAASEIIVQAKSITKIVFECSSSSYATALKNSIVSGASVSGNNVTVNVNPSKDTYTISSLTAQVRMFSVTVTCGGGTSSGGSEDVPNVDGKNPFTVGGTNYASTPLQDKLNSDRDFTVGIPSVGSPKALVIPVQIGNDAFTTTELNNIEIAFNGTSAQTGFESVNSYYKKASGNKLNLTFDVTSVYKTNKTQAYYENLYNDNDDYTNPEWEIIQGALKQFNSSYDFSDYDYNNDGAIDGIYLVYSISYSDEDPWWAWCWEDLSEDYGTFDGVYADYYVWASVDFLKDDITSSKSIAVNAETFIHETGHMLGLDDYYDYDEKNGPSGGLGGAAMMDYNVGDHDAFSKAIMGWSDPEVIMNSGTYTITPSVENNAALLIPLRSSNDILFGEYLLIDLYTPTSLNSVQAGYHGLFSTTGVRIYHVDARIDPSVGNPENWDGYGTIFSFNNSDTDYKIISLIERDGNNSIGSTGYASNSDLYRAGDSLDGVYNHSNQKINVLITIDSVSSSGATITIAYK